MISQPEIKFVDENIIEVQEDYRVYFEGYEWIIFKGFVCDGVSSPKFSWSIASKFAGDTLPAALIHDANYSAELLPRKVADNIFYKMLLANGVEKGRAKLYWITVRLFGYFVWKKHTSETILNSRQYCKVNS